MHLRLVLVLAAGVLATACAVGPDYRKPSTPLPDAYSGAANTQPRALPASAGDLDAWWARFNDPELSSLIDRALAGNLDLKTASSRIREAREQEILAGATGLPHLNADANVNRTHISQNSGISQFASLLGAGQGGGQGGQGGLGPPGSAFTSYTLGLDASWEIDVFGGVRRAVEAARAQAEEALWSARDSEVMISAQVANDYLLLRTQQRQIAVAQEEIARQEQTLALIQARQRFGFVTELDVRQQQAQLDASKASLPDLDAGMRAEIHALGALLGETPERLEARLTAPEALPQPPPAVPVGLPSQLLRRRPDIRAVERALAASNARIGVAVADLYPKLDLTGALDLVSLDLRHLLEASSRQSSAAGALSWPIFAAGQVRANIRIAKEENLQALYAYQKTVIGALQEVEDALTRYGDEERKNGALHSELTEAQAAAALARLRYQAGLVDFTAVLTAQGTALQASDQLAQSDGALDRDVVSLYEALGGGWRERPGGAMSERNSKFREP